MNIHFVVSPSRSTDSSTLDAILDAALFLFGQQGFHGTRVPEIATRAKVAAGTLYRYYPSKEALVNALFRRWKLALADALFDDLPVKAGLRKQLEQVWLRLLDFSEEHRDALLFLEAHYHASYLDEESARCEQIVHQRAVALIDARRGREPLKPLSTETLVALIWGMYLGVLRSAWNGDIEIDEPLSKAAVQCAWDAVTISGKR